MRGPDVGRLSAGAAARASAALALVLLLAAAWLLAPVHRTRTSTVALRAVLVDVSASVLRTRPEWALAWRAALTEQAEQAGLGGERLVVILFAADVELAFGPADPAGLRAGGRIGELLARRLDDSGSDLAGALELVRGLAAPDDRVELVLLGGAPAEVDRIAGSLWPRRVHVTRVAPPPARLADVALTGLRIPRGIEPGAPLAAELQLALTAPVPDAGSLTIELELELSGSGGDERLTATVVMPAAAARSGAPWSARVDLGAAAAGRTEVLVRARLDGDPTPENDARAATVRAGDALVLALAASPASAPAARAWLGQGLAGIQVVPSEPADLARLLDEADLLVTVDLAAGDLPLGELEAFVRGGGGWLACGGHRLFAGRPSALLPLVPADEGDPPRDIVLLLDGSGSMAGAPFEAVRAATLAAVELGRPRDVFRLRFFTDALGDEHLLGPGGEGTDRAAAELLRARLPRGPTDVPAVLEELAAARESAGRDALVLLLSDGRDQAPASPVLSRRLDAARERLEQAGARLAVVAMGERAATDFLALAAGAEPVLRPEDDAALAELFVERVAAARLRTAARIGIRAAEPGSARTLEARAVATALAGRALPPLEQVHRTRARGPEVEVLVWTEAGEPVIGLARAGAGLTAAWASAPLPGWAGAWAGSVELVGPLLRVLGRGRSERASGPTAVLADGVLEVSGASDWPPLVEGLLRGPGSLGTLELPLVLALPPAAPGADPRDRRVAPLSPGALAGLRGPRAELRVGPQALPVALPVAPEFLPEFSPPAPSGPPVTGGAGGAGGAGRLEAARSGAGARGGHPAGPWALALALGALTLAGALGWEGRRPRLQAPARPGR